MLKGIGLRRRAAGLITFVATVAAIMLVVPGAFAATGAINTTVDPGLPLGGQTTQPCVHGSLVNCNLYTQKQDVFLSGSPSNTGSGTYFFAVLSPGGQPDPNDGSDHLLSSDPATDREFYLASNNTITNLGSPDPHFLDGDTLLSAWPFNDTTNNGGVYIMAVCKISDTEGFVASPTADSGACKFDAFKVTGSPNTPQAASLDVTKDATPAYTVTYGWNVSKTVDGKSSVSYQQTNTTRDLSYSVVYTKDSGTSSAWVVKGNIYILNSGGEDATSVSLTDVIKTLDTGGNVTGTDTGASCSIDSGAPDYSTVASGDSLTIPYTCTYSAAPQADSERNLVTATYDDGVDSGNQTTTGQADFAWTDVTATKVNDSVTVDDTYTTVPTPLPSGAAISLLSGSKPSGSISASTTFSYVYRVTLPSGCLEIDNTAIFKFDPSSVNPDGSASTTAVICLPTPTGALTIGFWKGPNGQALLKSYSCPSGKTSLAAYLKSLGAGAGPFTDAGGCDLSSYVANIINKASATNMNTMLKAQMLATALDVYFSSTGWVAPGSGKTKTPGNFLPNGGVGTFNMDMTAVCPMIDNTTAGTATCQNNHPSTDAFASGAVPQAAMTVNQILAFAATLGVSPWATGAYTGSNVWYAGNRTFQEVLKNIFDQINNNSAFAA